MLKLPKLLDNDPANVVRLQSLQLTSRVLYPQGVLPIPAVDPHQKLLQGLAFARRCGSLRMGLENIETDLQTEETGFVMLKAREKFQETGRISRILVMSEGGSERFYRHCESLLIRYEHRVFGVKVNITPLELGKFFFGIEKTVKAALVCRKEAVAKVMVALLQGSGAE